jgi:glycerol-3-phosphate acyltransferase PlsY
LKWGGGAGTSPNVGWAFTIWWPIFPLSLLTMLLIFWTVGMASVVSLAVAVMIPLIFAVRFFTGVDPSPAYMIGGMVTAVLVAYALRPNIKRIFEGTERIVGPRAKRQQSMVGNR